MIGTIGTESWAEIIIVRRFVKALSIIVTIGTIDINSEIIEKENQYLFIVFLYLYICIYVFVFM